MSAFSIEHVLEIDAPAERVWQVIADLDRYAEWNRFVVSCRSSLEVGAPIDMRVRVFPFFAQPQRETIFEHEPGRRLCYGLPAHASGALESRRCHEVEALGPARARYVSRFQLSGWLAPVIRLLLGRRLAAGFTAMSDGIQRRAESMRGR
ncbi:MAG TPA: SRPBCC domain-containing protein [Myxococcota bacterium]|nr:SRPBCC domain-containing protein [Myxococcota bacterium]